MPPEPECQQNHDRSQQHPSRVTADVAGLQHAQHVANIPGARAHAVHCPVDQTRVNAAPKNQPRTFDQRLDHGCVINFIDEIFVVDQPVEAAHRFRERIRQAGTPIVE